MPQDKKPKSRKKTKTKEVNTMPAQVAKKTSTSFDKLPAVKKNQKISDKHLGPPVSRGPKVPDKNAGPPIEMDD